MRKLLVLLTALCLLPLCADARLRFRGGQPASGAPSVSCPFGNSLGDGCPGANTTITGAHQVSNFFTSYGPQDGQNYQSCSFTGSISAGVLTTSGETLGTSVGHTFTNCIQPGNSIQGAGISNGCFVASGTATPYTVTNCPASVSSEAMTALVRPPWNVAGVEYPVGSNNTGLTLATGLPTCPTAGTDNLCMVSGAFPAGSYAQCASTCTNITNIDFTGVPLFANSGFTGACTFQNNKFANASAIDAVGGAIYGVEVAVNTTCSSITFDHNDFDGQATVLNTGGAPAIFSQDGQLTTDIPVTWTYNYFHDNNGRASFQYSATFKYTYVEGLNPNGNGVHGEITAMAKCGNSAPCVTPITSIPQWSYGTFLNRGIDCGGQTAPVWFTNGGSNFTFSNGTQSDHNVFLNNMCNIYTITNVSGASLTISVPSTHWGAGTFQTTISGCGVSGCSGNNLAEPWSTAQGHITGQQSGTSGLSGTYTYNGLTAANGTLYSWNTSCPTVDLSGGTYNGTSHSNSNYVDPGGYLVNPFITTGVTTGASNACYVNVQTPDVTSNVNMNLNATAN